MWKINLSKQTDKFIKKNKIKDDEILLLINKFINYSKGSDENINVKSMKGKWEGYHRIRIGRVRMVLKMSFKEKTIFVDRMDYRGNVYK